MYLSKPIQLEGDVIGAKIRGEEGSRGVWKMTRVDKER